MDKISKTTAEALLKVKAIKLNPSNFFTWASGIRSPIYCDNRTTLSFPEVRKEVYEKFSDLISKHYPDIDLIAGVATGAIAHGVLVAERMEKPFVYVRPEAKGHGLTNQIEGRFKLGDRVVVVEDLVSTGGSSLKAVEALREAGCEVLGMVAIFSYGFEVARQNFEKARVELHTLTNYEDMIQIAAAQGYVAESDLEILKKWHAERVK